MRAILHGTWIVDAEGEADELFFVWAERATEIAGRGSGRGIRRHPYAATALEVGELLGHYVPDVDWRRAARLTRIALLPSGAHWPIIPRWLAGGDAEAVERPQLKPWRIEGIGVPLLKMLDLFVALPIANHRPADVQRVGDDLRFWGIAAKFVLELLARQRCLPGLRVNGEQVNAIWLPVLDGDQERFRTLAQAMPPVARALFRERPFMADKIRASLEATPPQTALQSFVERLLDEAVRDWGGLANRALPGQASLAAPNVAEAWWRALWAKDSQLKLPLERERELTDFYKRWQSWSYQAQSETEAAFRICFRLEPPEFDALRKEVVSPRWMLRYFLQATDDPSLLVPARDVWRERGSVLSYLNRRFDQPQETLLKGLGIAARLCPAIRRSLSIQAPESTTLTDEEAFAFLRETARLLEGLGFAVLVPPWWNKPDARLRVKANLQVQPETAGVLSMDSLVSFDWELALGDEPLTREEFERLAALKTPLVQVRGRWVLLQPDQIEAAIAFWEKRRQQSQFQLREALRLALGAETTVDDLPLGEIRLDASLSDLLNKLAGHEQIELLQAPPGLQGVLRPYQVRGLSWLSFLRKCRFGACLADDMGLGKTIQTIALLLHVRAREKKAGPALVICPTSLVGNWQRELARFAPGLRLMVHHGSGRAEGEEFVAQSMRADVVISTYGLVRRDIEDLMRVQWSDIILDEAQNIKNPLTKQARAVRRLRAVNRVALTGTPIENRLSELWSIMSFLNSGYLGSMEHFRRTFALPIERYQDQEASEKLRKLVRPFILRRLKTDPQVIQDLPEKMEYRVYCNLSREQATLYEAAVRDAIETLQKTDERSNGIKRRGLVLAMLTRLKQICDHPALFLGDGSALARRSGKLNRLTEMLEEILEVGDRALVFTQYAQMGQLLQQHLQEVFQQEVLFLHGGTPQKQRDRLLMRFQEDAHAPAIFVLSLKAGGTGLNLMRANHVFHYDRWWNPAVENQATDRAYRIGQSRDVQVHKFICVGTLEERIDELIESKRALADNIVGGGEGWLTELGTDELRELVALRAEAVETE